MDLSTLMTLYTVVVHVVYHLRICMKGDKPGLKNIKGDNYLFFYLQFLFLLLLRNNLFS